MDITLLLFLSTLFYMDACVGQRAVHIQGGPLYRVKGFPLTISCNVSGFTGSKVQDFDFSIYKPNRTLSEIRIISTHDPSFHYAVYAPRLKKGEIEIQRVTGSSVIFHIKTAQEEDTGEYECHTPNTDGFYFGSYNAKTTVNVIQDTLTVSSSHKAEENLEGEALQLECEATTQTIQHTHLSISWYLEGATLRHIISLERDFTLRPGDGFEERYRSGLIDLDKTGETTYRLQLSKLQVSDQGMVVCKVTEWIQDPDQSWTQISHKSTNVFNLQVQHVEVPDVNAFSVHIETPKEVLNEGSTLALKCRLQAQNVLDDYFSMVWLKDGQELARIGPTGIPAVGSMYELREREGELKVVKKSERDFLLSIRPIQREDRGGYRCRVAKEKKTSSGIFTQGSSQDSDIKQVAVSAKESSLKIFAADQTVTISEGDALRITCRVSVTDSHLSITWQHQPVQGSFSDVVSVSQSGVVESVGLYHQRVEMGDVRPLRLTADSFTLEIASALFSDSGVYKCTVFEWQTEKSGNRKKIDSKSQEVTAFVHSIDSLLKVDLKSRNVNARENEEIKLICKVTLLRETVPKKTIPRVPLSVTWKFQHTNAMSEEEIVSLQYNGNFTWKKECYNHKLEVVVVNANETKFMLRIFKASILDSGKYQCIVEPFLRQTQVSPRSSNVLGVDVHRPESKLSITIWPRSPLNQNATSDVKIECRILTATSNSSRFIVSWLLQQKGERNRAFVSSDHECVVTGPGLGPRYSFRKRTARSYELEVQQAESGDSGIYYCLVEEWLQDPHGIWYPLVQMSTSTELNIHQKKSDLHVLKHDHNVTVSGQQADFTVSCDITSHASNTFFEVTWWHRQGVNGEGEAQPIFRAYRNFTLLNLSKTRGSLVFGRPRATLYTLTISNPQMVDAGQYHCQVEEWLLTPRNIWMKIAEDTSGNLTVRVQEKDIKPLCSSEKILAVLLPIIILLVGVILILCYKLTKTRGEIEIQRVTGSSVIFHIKTAQEEDTGEYECHTPNTDGFYFGSYNAKTTVNVIQDTLTVSSSHKAEENLEGEALQLECEATTQTIQHTHLSISWYLEGATLRHIISLERDFTLRPGDGFEERYRSGLIDLDKTGETTYRLQLSKLQVSDQGMVVCKVTEWIQDPDQSWTQISHKSTNVFNLQVQHVEVPDVNAFSVHIETPKEVLNEGSTLALKCRLQAQNVLDDYFSMVWLKDGQELARIGPTGIPAVGSMYELREREGELKVVKKSERDFLLSIRPIQREDRGGYRCRVAKEKKTSSGIFTQGSSQDSDIKQVAVSAKESSLKIFAADQTVTISEGDALRITCRVSVTDSHLSITWQHQPVQGSFSDVVSVSQSGVVESVGLYHQRVEMGDVRPLRLTADSFTLEIASALFSDSGVYKCTVFEWQTEKSGNRKKIDSKSQEVTAFVHSIDSLLKVDLKSRNVNARENEEIKLICKVTLLRETVPKKTIPRVPLSVTWKFQHTNAMSEEEIVSLQYNGNFTWKKECYNHKLEVVVVNANETKFMLRIFKASILDSGKYQCIVEPFLRQTQVSPRSSNVLGVDVHRPESKLSITIWPRSPLNQNATSDVKIECRILTATSNSSRFIVSWLLQQKGERNRAFVSSDHECVVTGPGLGPRYSFRKRTARSYELEVQQAESGDSGIYYCLVEEWLQDPHGIWYPLVQMSTSTELNIHQKKSDLHVLKHDHNVTVSGQQADFTVSCDITSHASNTFFEVTWWHRQGVNGEGEAQPIFRAYRNFTLLNLSKTRGSLVFGRPRATLYTLTISNPQLVDAGQYHCQVEEWLLTPRNIWMKIAEDTSGNLTVRVQEKDIKPLCSSEKILAVLLPIIILLVGVILILCYKLTKTRGGLKKNSDCLWAEGIPMKPTPET